MAENNELPEETGNDNPAADTVGQDEGKTPRTFTADEVDAIVKGRIDKQRRRHDEETSGLAEQVAALKKELADAKSESDALKASAQRAELVASVEESTKVPASILTHDALSGATDEQLKALAEAIAETYKPSRSIFDPMKFDKGDQRSPGGRSEKETFVSGLFNRKE